MVLGKGLLLHNGNHMKFVSVTQELIKLLRDTIPLIFQVANGTSLA